MALGCRKWTRCCPHPASLSRRSGLGIFGLAVLWEFDPHLAPSPHPRHKTAALRAGSPTSVVHRAGATNPAPSHQQPFAFEQTQTGADGDAPAALPGWKPACSSPCAEQEALGKPVPWHGEGVRSFYLTVQLRKFSHEAGMKTCVDSKSKYSIQHGHFFSLRIIISDLLLIWKTYWFSIHRMSYTFHKLSCPYIQSNMKPLTYT